MTQKAYLLGGRIPDERDGDDQRIDVEQSHEVRYWSKKFGVTEDEIRQAVKSAGPMLKDVRAKLAENRSY